jgi:hypothetical protein
MCPIVLGQDNQQDGQLGCDHYYSDVAFLKPNENFTIANSADI